MPSDEPKKQDKEVLPAPFLKWAGGKKQLLEEIKKYLPNDYATYYEPFVGGGAVLFYLKPSHAVINDLNKELVSCYRAIQTRPDLVIRYLRQYQNTEACFYRVRHMDRRPNFRRFSLYQHAARTIYLNHTCYNGLYRENSDGFFNTPFGGYICPNFINQKLLLADNRFLANNDIRILNGDFEEAVANAGPQDFVYFDPPYDPVRDDSFVAYQKGGFGREDQVRLKNLCDALNARGARFLLSNSSTPFMRELYRPYHEHIVQAKRNINSKGDEREPVDEILVSNY